MKKSKDEGIELVLQVAVLHGHSPVKTSATTYECDSCYDSIFEEDIMYLFVQWPATISCGQDRSNEASETNVELVEHLRADYDGNWQ